MLSDPEKRKQYDKYGHNSPSIGSGFTSSNANDIFKHFFTDFGFDNDEDDVFFSPFF